jgi:hypothetical protein
MIGTISCAFAELPARSTAKIMPRCGGGRFIVAHDRPEALGSIAVGFIGEITLPTLDCPVIHLR